MPNARSLRWIAAPCVFAASLAVTVWLGHVPTDSTADNAPPSGGDNPRPGWEARPATYVQYLRALGLTEEENRALVLARLQAREQRRLATVPFRYWAGDNTAGMLRAAIEQTVAADRIRASLRETYGAAAVNDPIFAPLFRPLEARLPFLSSEQQVRLYKARLDLRLAAAEGARSGAAPELAGRAANSGVDTRVPHPETSRSWRESLESLLDDEQLFEYELRESPLAEHLRNSGVAFNEEEFRETYAILATLAERAASHAYREARARLRALLGSQRFDRLWAGRDPAYPVTDEILRAHDFPEPTILAAYGVINFAQDALIEAAALADRDPARAVNEAREISAREHEQLAALVGDEIASQVLTARAQALFEMSQQTSATP